MRTWLAALLMVAACTGARHPAGWPGDSDAHILLYRDGALVREVVPVTVAAGERELVVPLARGVVAADVTVTSDDLAVVSWRVGGLASDAAIEARAGGRTVAGKVVFATAEGDLAIDGRDGLHLMRAPAVVAGDRQPVLRITVAAGHAGTGHVVVGYLTDRLSWQASYTLIASGERGRLHGAIGLDNGTGRSWERARLAVVDRNRPTGPIGTIDDRVVRVAGAFVIRPGPQRLDLALGGGELRLMPTLVYDPLAGVTESNEAQSSEDYMRGPWSTAVDESLKIDLSNAADGPLPAGPIRVFTVGDGGVLVRRGEGRLLPPADNAERYTTVAVGRVPDVIGHRRRTEFAHNEDTQRIIEEFTITLANQRKVPVDVLVNEHLTRHQCWTLAYHSTGERVAKLGSQTISLGVTVPAGGESTVMYRVVYEFGTCLSSLND